MALALLTEFYVLEDFVFLPVRSGRSVILRLYADKTDAKKLSIISTGLELEGKSDVTRCRSSLSGVFPVGAGVIDYSKSQKKFLRANKLPTPDSATGSNGSLDSLRAPISDSAKSSSLDTINNFKNPDPALPPKPRDTAKRRIAKFLG